jgi:hypothetical protein
MLNSTSPRTGVSKAGKKEKPEKPKRTTAANRNIFFIALP